MSPLPGWKLAVRKLFWRGRSVGQCAHNVGVTVAQAEAALFGAIEGNATQHHHGQEA